MTLASGLAAVLITLALGGAVSAHPAPPPSPSGLVSIADRPPPSIDRPLAPKRQKLGDTTKPRQGRHGLRTSKRGAHRRR